MYELRITFYRRGQAVWEPPEDFDSLEETFDHCSRIFDVEDDEFTKDKDDSYSYYSEEDNFSLEIVKK